MPEVIGNLNIRKSINIINHINRKKKKKQTPTIISIDRKSI